MKRKWQKVKQAITMLDANRAKHEGQGAELQDTNRAEPALLVSCGCHAAFSISQHCGQDILCHHLINLAVHVLSAVSACCHHDDYWRVREDEDFIPAIPAAIESFISSGVNSVAFIPPQIAIAVLIRRGLFA